MPTPLRELVKEIIIELHKLNLEERMAAIEKKMQRMEDSSIQISTLKKLDALIDHLGLDCSEETVFRPIGKKL